MNFSYQDGCYTVEEINYSVRHFPSETVAWAERKYKKQVEDLATEMKGKAIMLLAGPSSSGKTTTAHRIEAAMKKLGRDVEVMSLDDFYKCRSTMPIINGKRNFDVVEAYEIGLVQQSILELLRKGVTMMPEYDFLTGIRRDNVRRVDLDPNGVIIIEGIHALSSEVRSSFDSGDVYNVYISPHSGFMTENGEKVFTKREMRRIRRVVRDIRFRDSSAENTLSLWPAVCEAEDAYIRPSVRYADFVIDTTHIYEPCLLKTPATDAFSQIGSESEYYRDAVQTIEKIGKFDVLDLSYMPQDSMMREFLG